MNWNKHSRLEGLHATLGASKYHWINYDEDKLRMVYSNMQSAMMGTRLHAFAAEAIKLGRKQKANHDTLNMYINDAIGYKMTPEQVLFYSENCFGTADAICFRNGKLRIHDLKTGTGPTHIEQLYIYEALFCLEYDYRPGEIEAELRIYQNNEVLIDTPSVGEIAPIMDKIIFFDKIINEMKEQE